MRRRIGIALVVLAVVGLICYPLFVQRGAAGMTILGVLAVASLLGAAGWSLRGHAPRWSRFLLGTAGAFVVGLLMLAFFGPILRLTTPRGARESVSQIGQRSILAKAGQLLTRLGRDLLPWELDASESWAEINEEAEVFLLEGGVMKNKLDAHGHPVTLKSGDIVKHQDARPTQHIHQGTVFYKFAMRKGGLNSFTQEEVYVQAGLVGKKTLSPQEASERRGARRSGITAPAVRRVSLPTGAFPCPQYEGLVDKHLAAAGNAALKPLVGAMMVVESSCEPDAVNPETKAQGLMQLLPGTAGGLGVTNPFDPDQNIGGGIRYLMDQLRDFSSTELALAAYHWGPENVRKHSGKTWEQILASPNEPRPGPRTISYVRDVIARAQGAGQRGTQLARTTQRAAQPEPEVWIINHTEQLIIVKFDGGRRERIRPTYGVRWTSGLPSSAVVLDEEGNELNKINRPDNDRKIYIRS